jgi:hypothetical protein
MRAGLMWINALARVCMLNQAGRNFCKKVALGFVH